MTMNDDRANYATRTWGEFNTPAATREGQVPDWFGAARGRGYQPGFGSDGPDAFTQLQRRCDELVRRLRSIDTLRRARGGIVYRSEDAHGYARVEPMAKDALVLAATALRRAQEGRPSVHEFDVGSRAVENAIAAIDDLHTRWTQRR